MIFENTNSYLHVTHPIMSFKINESLFLILKNIGTLSIRKKG